MEDLLPISGDAHLCHPMCKNPLELARPAVIVFFCQSGIGKAELAVETESGKEAYCEGFSMRASERVRVNVSVAYSLDPPHPSGQEIETFHSGTLLDIGDRGLCFKARGYFPVGRMLLLKLKLVDHTDAIRMLGTTVWTSSETDGSTRVGARFIGALPSDWRKLLSNDT